MVIADDAVIWLVTYNTVPSDIAVIVQVTVSIAVNILTVYVVPLVAVVAHHCSLFPCDWLITCTTRIDSRLIWKISAGSWVCFYVI